MKTHDATETAYKNGYKRGVKEAKCFFQNRRRETWIKKYLLSVIAYFLIAAICVAWVCAFCKNAKEEVVVEIKEEIQKSVEPKIIKIIERESEPEAEADRVVAEPTIKKSLGKFKLTAYCSCKKCCGVWAENRPIDEHGEPIVYGSIGVRLEEGVSVAVDPSVIPYGSQVEINGNTYTAHDTGGSITGNRIDIYHKDHQKAVEFGVQYAEVFVRC